MWGLIFFLFVIYALYVITKSDRSIGAKIGLVILGFLTLGFGFWFPIATYMDERSLRIKDASVLARRALDEHGLKDEVLWVAPAKKIINRFLATRGMLVVGLDDLYFVRLSPSLISRPKVLGIDDLDYSWALEEDIDLYLGTTLSIGGHYFKLLKSDRKETARMIRKARDLRKTSLAEEDAVCPQCAETIKAAAKICRFCGYRFDEETVDA